MRETMRGVGVTWLSGCEGSTDREWDATEKADDAKSTSQSVAPTRFVPSLLVPGGCRSERRLPRLGTAGKGMGDITVRQGDGVQVEPDPKRQDATA